LTHVKSGQGTTKYQSSAVHNFITFACAHFGVCAFRISVFNVFRFWSDHERGATAEAVGLGKPVQAVRGTGVAVRSALSKDRDKSGPDPAAIQAELMALKARTQAAFKDASQAL
jgi:hypothetical protein